MKRGSTHVLRGTIYLIGLIVLGLCLVGLPLGIKSELKGDFDYGIIFTGLYVPAIPFFYALHQALRILSLIDKNQAFTARAVRAFRNIKYCALVISGLFALGMPYIFYLADQDDAPGVAATGFAIIGASFVIATFAAVLQKLIQNAVDIKLENDLTV